MAKGVRERVLLGAVQPAPSTGAALSSFQFVTTGEDQLRFRAWSLQPADDPAEVELGLRTVDATGTLQVATHRLFPPSTGARQEAFLPLAAGAVVNLSVRYVPQGYPRGATYVAVDLIRGTSAGNSTVLGQLLGDYVGPGKSVAWPGSPIVDWRAGPGVQRRHDFGAPAAGLELGMDLQLPRAWRPLVFEAVFVASAAAGARFPTIRAVKTGVVPLERIFAAPLLVQLAAAGSADLGWATGYGAQMVGVPPRYFGPLPTGVLLSPGTTIETWTVGLQAGDQWVGGALWVEELVVPL